MDTSLPGILLTGASGFVGRNFIKSAAGRFRLFCVARRSMEEAGVQPDQNLRWIQVDLGDGDAMLGMIKLISDHGGVDYIVNLAGYYDFTNKESDNYVRTNVTGVQNILEVAKELKAKRFIMASSLAACPFGATVTEDTPPDADIPYARSKRAGEELVHRYSQYFPCAIVRIAAVFSDWCEYPPLYALMGNWLSGRFPDSRVIAGCGLSAVPYIHVHDVVQLLLRVIEKSESLGQLRIFNASPDGAVTHLELYRVATQFYYNKDLRPLFLPTFLLFLVIPLKRLFAYLQGKEPFEQTWMLKFVDKQLVADCARTRKELDWRPTPRKAILRRLVFMIENMKRHPELWRSWNEAMIHKDAHRPHLALYELLCDALDAEREDAVETVVGLLVQQDVPDAQMATLQSLRGLNSDTLRSYVRLLLQLVVSVIRTKNRPRLQQNAHNLAFRAMNAGFGNGLGSHCLFIACEHLIKRFQGRREFQCLSPGADEYVAMTIHMAMDRIEDHAEAFKLQTPGLIAELRKTPIPEGGDEFDEVVLGLVSLCREVISGKSPPHPVTVSARREGACGPA